MYNDGSEGEFSNEVDVLVNIKQPGGNLVINGDFQYGISAWDWQLNSPASAQFRVRDNVAQIVINQGGNNIHDIHIRQIGLPLINGRRYVFEFDAWADAVRVIEAKVAQNQSPWINYSKIGYTALSTRQKSYSYEFEMQDASDTNARIVFNCGTDVNNVYIDNVSLKLVTDSAVEHASSSPSGFHLYANYPNPFNPNTTIRFDLPEQEHVRLDILNVRGQHTITLIDAELNAGRHQIPFHAENLPSGVYLYRIITPTREQIRKMVLMR